MNWFEFQQKRLGLTDKDVAYKSWTSLRSVDTVKLGNSKHGTLKLVVDAMPLSEIEKEIIYAERGFFVSPTPAITKMAALVVLGMGMGWLDRVDYGEKFRGDTASATLLHQISQKFEGGIGQ